MVETERLVIVPLNYDQLRLYLKGNGKLEKELQLTTGARNVSDEVKESVEFFILPSMKNTVGDHYLFYTFWLIVEKASRRIVGESGFKGSPNDKGEIEIGYGIFSHERRKGLMTEAIGGMVEWAKKRADVNYILAEADENNLASIRVLQKNNFDIFDKKEKMLWWKTEVISRPVL
jgi:ribosomal-protein-alanine N-acetyltransferase